MLAGCGSAQTVTVTTRPAAKRPAHTTTTAVPASAAAVTTTSGCPVGEQPYADGSGCYPAPTVDCAVDGTGGGGPDRFGGCSYIVPVGQWCGGPRVDYPIDSPPGTFLVVALNLGQGFGLFRWSDGAVTQTRVC